MSQSSTSAPSGGRAPLLPTPPVIHRPSPKVGQVIYAMNLSVLKIWLQAKVMKIKRTENFQREDGEPKFHNEYVVQYEPTSREGNPVEPRGVMKEGAVRMVRQLTMKEMAYRFPCPFTIPVGIRVIAEFRSESSSARQGGKAGHFYSGIVAERPKSSTKDRYLIFFDDGSALYVYPERVFMVCQMSKKVWSDVHPNSYDFIEKYVTSYPNWPMVPLKEGSLVPVEWNGSWYNARVVELDCAVAKVQFENDKRTEWIYRGSGRFYSVNKNNDDQESSETATPSDIPLGYQGFIKKVEVPRSMPRSKDFEPHECGPDCVIPYIPNSELNKLSPLAIPLFLGWTREINESASRKKFYYQTPCGIKLIDYQKLKMYLRETQSNLPVDFFYFEADVNVLNEFVPASVLVKVDDISEGKEAIPIQVANSIDTSLPEFEYISKSIPSPEVDINTNEEHILCCNCAKNCQAKPSCKCWKLTLKNKKRVSYKNRRLEEYVLEGVYECNKRCPCNMTCENRLVQAGMKWPLQVFQTNNKGWGVRALYDIPKGTYLCSYTGEILTDDAAEESAKKYGSVYMANLSYTHVKTGDNDSYVVDARLKGNVSRFINHSCDPNARLQNVFTNTHDVQCPEIALFTTCVVKAGSELAFDYGYRVGSVPGTTLYCSCEKPSCHGRLL